MENQLASTFNDILLDRAPEMAKTTDTGKVKDIIEEAKKEAIKTTPIFHTDKWIYRITVGVLGLAVLGVIAAQYGITMNKIQGGIPDGLVAIGSAAIGAIAGLLAPTNGR